MDNKFIPKLKLRVDMDQTKINPFENSLKPNSVQKQDEIPKFKEVFTDLVKSSDNTVKAPDQVLESAMLGNGADIHDVMVAMSKAELSVRVATQVTSKVIQAYEKVISIQL